VLLKLGDQDIPFHSEFRFYITTKLPNPHYLPELSIKVTIINFTVTMVGLEDQVIHFNLSYWQKLSDLKDWIWKKNALPS
jgi:hypothetical protein